MSSKGGCGDAEGTVGEFKFDIYEFTKILWFRRMKKSVYNGDYFVMYPLFNFEPVKGFNPLDVGRRYTDFAQTSLRRRTAVYRPNGSLPHEPEDGIPAARCIVDPRRRTVYNLCFLMHTGPSNPES